MEQHDDGAADERPRGLWATPEDGAATRDADCPPDATGPSEPAATTGPSEPAATTDEVAPTKVCPSCSVAERTSGAFCPHCGTPYSRDAARRKRRRPSRKVTLTIVALVLLIVGGGTATAMVVKHNQDAKEQRARDALARKRAAERHRRELAAAAAQKAADEAAEQARKEQAAKDALARTLRRSLVSDLRKAITKDARSRVADGFLEGPIYGTQCDPIGGGNASNLDARTGRYSCLAYNKKNDDGTIEGYGFSATINYEKFSYQWHLGND